jgi:hypothetical protein
MSSKKITFLKLLLAGTAIGALIGYLLYNKPHQNVATASAVSVTAVALYNSFITDTATAGKRYLQQVIQVSGTIKSITSNQQNQQVLLLQTNTNGASVNCTMEAAATNTQPGHNIIVKGICQGLGQADAELGIAADLYISRCYQVKE